MQAAVGFDSTQSIPPQGIDLGPGRRRVTQQDVNLFRALVAPTDTQPQSAETSAGSNRGAWSGVLSRKALARWSRTFKAQLDDCYQGITGRTGRIEFGELGSWVRRISNDARRRLQLGKQRPESTYAAPIDTDRTYTEPMDKAA